MLRNLIYHSEIEFIFFCTNKKNNDNDSLFSLRRCHILGNHRLLLHHLFFFSFLLHFLFNFSPTPRPFQILIMPRCNWDVRLHFYPIRFSKLVEILIFDGLIFKCCFFMLNRILNIVDFVLNDIVWWKWYEIEFIHLK